MASDGLLRLIHRGLEDNIKTLSEFMDSEYVYGITPQKLFDFNRENIFNQMTDEDWLNHKDIDSKKSDYQWTKDDLYLEMQLPIPCMILIEEKYVTSEIAIATTNLEVTYNSEDNAVGGYMFWSDLIEREYFQKIDRISINENVYKKHESNFSVLGWFKSVGSWIARSEKLKNTGYNSIDTSLCNLSNFADSIDTHVDENGGNFTIRFPFVELLTGSNGLYVYEPMYGTDMVTNEMDYSQYYFELLLKDERIFDGYFKSDFNGKFDYFSSLISSNDLIFISMEAIPELKNNSSDYSPFRVHNQDFLSDCMFDMIGLVDNVSIVKNAGGTNAYVEVSGRDLIKLLIDDSSNFFATSVSTEPWDIFGNNHGDYSAEKGKTGDIRNIDAFSENYIDPIKRLRRLTGDIDIFSNRINMSLSFILKGVISQLTNIEIVGGDLFKPWGDNRTRFYELYPNKKEEGKQ